MKAFGNLSWKKKNRLLLAAALLFAWIIYSAAISRTLELRTTCVNLQNEIDSAQGAPEQIAALQAELNSLNAFSALSDSAANDSTMHEQLLDDVALYCSTHNVVLRGYAPPVRYRRDNWIVETHAVTVEAGYVEIVKMLDHLRNFPSARIVATDIHTEKDNKNRKTALLATIYIQNISIIQT